METLNNEDWKYFSNLNVKYNKQVIFKSIEDINALIRPAWRHSGIHMHMIDNQEDSRFNPLASNILLSRFILGMPVAVDFLGAQHQNKQNITNVLNGFHC